MGIMRTGTEFVNQCINIDLSNANHNAQGTTNVEAIHDTVYVKNPLLNSNQEINVSNYD